MFDFNKCHPIELDDLIHIGNKFDGGYVLSKKQIEKTEILLSFGVNLDWSFERSFYKEKKTKIYSYDYSTKAHLDKNIFGRIFRFLRSSMIIFYYLILLKPSRAENHLWRLFFRSTFYKFFNDKQGRYFIPKFIGNYDDDIYTCFDTIFKELGEINNLSVFIKMDIEGSEYDSLPQLFRYLDKVNGLVVEFHDLEKCENQFINLLDELKKQFYIAHVHGCNYSHLIKFTNIPNVLEITFINKKMVEGNIIQSKKNYPIKGLDFPNKPFKKDYVLNFAVRETLN